jgi:hypothetical protein
MFHKAFDEFMLLYYIGKNSEQEANSIFFFYRWLIYASATIIACHSPKCRPTYKRREGDEKHTQPQDKGG